MCRNIKPLFNFEPPATSDEIHDAALQFVRKISGFSKPSQANQAAFDQAVAAVAQHIDVLQRAVSTASTSNSDPAALERLLGLMCAAVEARCALLVGSQGQAHAASFCAQDMRAQAVSVQDIVSARSGIVARARQSLLAFGSSDVTGLAVRRDRVGGLVGGAQRLVAHHRVGDLFGWLRHRVTLPCTFGWLLEF